MIPPDEPRGEAAFDLTAGALCLDFSNTWEKRSDPGADLLIDYGRLVDFCYQAESMESAQIAGFAAAARARPEEAAAALEYAHALRDALYRTFSALAAGAPGTDADLEWINGALGTALSRRRLEHAPAGFSWTWSGAGPDDLRALLWPIVESAATLLGSEDADRIRACDADDCDWLFLDRSRNGRRKWCSMKSCGNRAKARRHYRRQQKA